MCFKRVKAISIP